MKRILTITLFSLFTFFQIIEAKSTLDISLNNDEHWWGCLVSEGSKMPFGSTLISVKDMSKSNFQNQAQPLFLSDKGNYIWSNDPFAFSVDSNKIHIVSKTDNLKIVNAGSTLRDAFLEVSRRYFPADGTTPAKIMFTNPQYNTWIELLYDESQERVLNYAKSIKDNGFPDGVLMIDDNWEVCYGDFNFKKDKFPDPKHMVNQLHNMGFKVMLWISPFVTADTQIYRELSKREYLLKSKDTKTPIIIPWWNGYSAMFDLTNPKAFSYLKDELFRLKKATGIDGYKLDAGDIEFYNYNSLAYDSEATAPDQSEKWVDLGRNFKYNEFRACWKNGGKGIAQRLCDKAYSWEAIQCLIPDMLASGLLGHAFTCPDMIGGGSYTTFENINQDSFDQTLIVRSAQVHAMMPMMQFSVAPWRILSKENLENCIAAAQLHLKMGKYIWKLARHASKTGEPIVRHMEYVFPHQGFAECKDQFMLGNDYLVAPVVTISNIRTIKLPEGTWIDDLGKKFVGPTSFTINVPLNRLPYYKKM